MRSLAYLAALLATIAVPSSMWSCVPDDYDPNHTIVPATGASVASGIGQGDNTGGGGPGPNEPLGDGGVFGDTGPLLDAFDITLDVFDFPLDAAEPLDPGTDQIP